jgi:hypothetical protein
MKAHRPKKKIEISEATIYFKKKLSRKARFEMMESIWTNYPVEAIFFKEVLRI